VKSQNFNRTKYACYFAYVSTAAVFALPALLFTTFQEMYGISFTLLGTLVLINFFTQMTIDTIFTFFNRYFNIHKTIRTTPLLTSLGLFLYAIFPMIFPQYAYVGLVLGTVIFSVSAGLGEVLLSPTVAALPSENTERDMSVLHSLYGYGVVSVVVISTIVLKLFGTENWMYLSMFWALLPIVSFVLFSTAPLPDISLSNEQGGKKSKHRTYGMALCVACIFLGSAAENTMTNWVSSFMESALQIPKVVGDILGLATFAALLALTRTLYAKYGKNITAMLFYGMLGAAICYLTAALCPNAIVALIACIFTGVCTSMLWPGTLIFMEEKFSGPGVAAYALMAAGGDFGASVAPQMMGAVVDWVAASNWAAGMSQSMAITPEQLGMKVGMITSAIFPILGVLLILYMKKYFAKNKAEA